MAIVPRQTYPWQQNGENEEEEPYFHASPQHDNQLWNNRGPGYLDVIMPPPGFSVWELPSDKVQSVAVACTFIATAIVLSGLAALGLFAILITGAMMWVGVLLLITMVSGAIALVVTGVPVGYAVWKVMSKIQESRSGY